MDAARGETRGPGGAPSTPGRLGYLPAFESGMHEAFLAYLAVTLQAAAISGLRPGHNHFGLKL
ncbi:MAG: hypothetical protein NTX42_11880 [Methanothrix sp.]|nr:hypothetical protein [Methanothrix sp.]